METRLRLIGGRENTSQFDSSLIASLAGAERDLGTIENEDLKRGEAVHGWLKPTEMENEQLYLSRIRADYPDTCQWLLDDETFKEWFLPQHTNTALRKLLWLNGKPGSGR
jgi:hypothetical protein